MVAPMDALTPYVASGDILGIVAVVAKGDDVDLTVIGDQAVGGAPMREDSLVRIASAGKPTTAVAVLTLVADGKVALGVTHRMASGRSNPHSRRVRAAVRRPQQTCSRSIACCGRVGGTGTAAYAVPTDGSIAILLTQVELGGPDGSLILESFWTAAASHVGHNS